MGKKKEIWKKPIAFKNFISKCYHSKHWFEEQRNSKLVREKKTPGSSWNVIDTCDSIRETSMIFCWWDLSADAVKTGRSLLNPWCKKAEMLIRVMFENWILINPYIHMPLLGFSTYLKTQQLLIVFKILPRKLTSQ